MPTLLFASTPQSLDELLIFVVVAVVGLLGFLVRSIIGQIKVAEKRAEAHLTLLTNHLTHDQETMVDIRAHMATQNELSRLMIDELRELRK